MQYEVELWLSSHNGYFIAALREIALRTHPSMYGKPPGVAELVKMQGEAYSRGHDIEAIEAARNPKKMIGEVVENVTEEEALKRAAELRYLMEHGRREELG
jgi:hypothetical protein